MTVTISGSDSIGLSGSSGEETIAMLDISVPSFRLEETETSKINSTMELAGISEIFHVTISPESVPPRFAETKSRLGSSSSVTVTLLILASFVFTTVIV